MQKIFKQPMRTKRGSSLPMVLAIGLVLVIWVMGLTPIITTQGKASIDVQNQEGDYLQSRSAIEFTKGELVNMVADGTPHTFAVLREEGVLSPCPRDDAAYTTYVNAQPLDKNDVPTTTDNGDKVAAICSVWKEPGERMYRIQVHTYNKGESGMTFNTTYTPPVLSEQVYPESYKKTEALPLSDFVLVDGHLGSETLWHSPLTFVEEGETNPKYSHTSYINVASGSHNGMFESYKSDFKETLLPVGEDADAGSYPAVFKVTAEAAPLDGEEAPEGGSITGATEMTLGAPGTPQFTVTTTSSGGNKYARVTLTIGNPDYALFAHSTEKNPASVNWQKYSSSLFFTLSKTSDNYIFCYIAGHAEGNTLLPDSAVVSQKVDTAAASEGMVHNNSYTALQDGKQYVMYVRNSDTYTYLGNSENGFANNHGLYAGSVQKNHVFDPASAPVWIVHTVSGGYTFQSSGGKYLHLYHSGGTKYFELSDEPSVFSYSSQKLKSGSYWIDIGDPSEFATSKSSKAASFYFFPYEPSAGSGGGDDGSTGTTSKLPVNVTKKDITVENAIDMTALKAQFAVSGASNFNIHLVPQSTSVYTVYGTWTEFGSNGRPLFAELGTVTMMDPPEIPATGYGISGRALYFMGEDYAINTGEDETVHLKADLLVIRGDLDEGNGEIVLNPYSCSDTLAFFVHGTDAFEAYNFYQIPAGTELTGVDADQARSWLVCDSSGDYVNGSEVEYVDDDPTKGVESVVFPDRVIIIETSGEYNYPVINFDIAYATDEQLAHVVSGRAARWVDASGRLIAKKDETPNGWYVVCPFVTDVAAGDITRSANRILMVSEAESLDVAGKVKLISRYWSVNVKQIAQIGNAEFKLYCLTAKENIVELALNWLSTWLGDIDYSSDTMQVDYEQATEIVPSAGSSTTMPAQICRYENGTDLFDHSVSPEASKEDLRIEYDVDSINTAFNSEAISATIVERYMHLYGNRTDTLSIGRDWLKCKLQLYSNYISFDSSVKKINVDAGFTGNSIFNIRYDRSELILNSQETGYTSDEYLYLFTTSAADTYTGTMLYFEDNVKVIYPNRIGRDDEYTISKGFYYIPAGGANFLAIQDGQCLLSKYHITKEDVAKYTKYIDPNTGSMNSAYVDTGFETDDATVGGFGGGSVN